MSIRFDAAADRLLRTTNIPDLTQDNTFDLWVYFVSAPASSYQCILSLNANTYANNILFIGREPGTNALYLDNGAQQATGGTLSNSTWYHLTVAIDNAANLIRGLVDGTQVATVAQPGPNTLTRFELGGFTTGNSDRLDGRVFGLHSYAGRLLTTAESIANSRLITPSTWGSIDGFYPMRNANDGANDYSGNGRSFTATGITYEDNPRVAWGPPVEPAQHWRQALRLFKLNRSYLRRV